MKLGLLALFVCGCATASPSLPPTIGDSDGGSTTPHGSIAGSPTPTTGGGAGSNVGASTGQGSQDAGSGVAGTGVSLPDVSVGSPPGADDGGSVTVPGGD